MDQIFSSSTSPELYEDYVKDARDYIKLAEERNGPIPRHVSPDYIWGEALRIWKDEAPDFKIINLETAVTRRDTPLIGKGINYRMHPDNLEILQAPGIDFVCLANNHILDWKRAGLLETISSLDKLSIQHSGAGANLTEAKAPTIFQLKEGRVLVFSLCLETSGVPWDWKAGEEKEGVWLIQSTGKSGQDEVSEVIRSFKEEDDVVILSIHWGGNWGYDISDSQKDFAHNLIDEGLVDIIHGHSSHHPKGFEVYKGHPIFYGCGDFINDYEGIRSFPEFHSDLTLMYFVEFVPRPFLLKSMTMYPLKMKNFRLVNTSRYEAKWIYDVLKNSGLPESDELLLEENARIKFKYISYLKEEPRLMGGIHPN